MCSCEKVGLEGRSRLPALKRGKGRARSLGIRLGRWIRRSSTNLHPKPTTRGLVHIRGHPWVLGQVTGNLDYLTHHGPDSGEATTFPHIVFSAALCRGYIQMAFFPRLSRWSPETVLGWSPGTLDGHSSSPQARIGTNFKPKL